MEKIIARNNKTGEELVFESIAACARHFEKRSQNIFAYVKNGNSTRTGWGFSYKEKNLLQFKKKTPRQRTYNKEIVHTGKVPANLMSVNDIVDYLGISDSWLYNIVKRKGIKGILYYSEDNFYFRRYFYKKDVEKIRAELRLKHNARQLNPVIAFNWSVKDGKVYHFQDLYNCRYILQKKFQVKLTIEQCHLMLQNGIECKGWFIDEEA